MKILKKSIAVFIAALMLVSVMTVAGVAAATENQLKVNVTSNLTSAKDLVYDVSVDKTVTVTYKLTTDLAIVNSEGELTYDSSVLALKSFTLPNVSNSTVNTEPVNTVKFNHTIAEGEAKFAKGADLVVAEFDVVKAGETTVDLQVAELNAEGEGANFNELVSDSKAVSDKFSVTSALSASKAQADPKLSKTSVKLAAGKTYKIKVQNTTAKATYSSNKKSVATVSDSGKVTALKKGDAVITVKVAGKNLKFKVKVTSSPKLKVGKKNFKAKTTYSVNKNSTLKVKITGKAAAVNNKYKTSKKSVAKVVSNTKATTVKIKGLKKGNAKITLTVNKVKFTIKVKVK